MSRGELRASFLERKLLCCGCGAVSSCGPQWRAVRVGSADELSPPHRPIRQLPAQQHPLPFRAATAVSLSSSSLLSPRRAQPNHHHAARLRLRPHSRSPEGRRRAGAAMGTVSAATGWTAEDDVLLKNAVEVIHHAARPDPSIPLPYPSNSRRASRRRRGIPSLFVPLPSRAGRSMALGLARRLRRVRFTARPGWNCCEFWGSVGWWGSVLVRRACGFGGANRSAEIELRMRSCSLPVAY